MDIKIRKTEKSDVYCIDKLIGELHDFHVFNRPDKYKKSDHPYTLAEIKEILNNPDYISFIAVCGDNAVGICIAAIRESSNPLTVQERIGYIEDLYVLNEYRRRNIAQSLLENIKKEFYRKGVRQLELCVWEFNNEAIKFYEKEGFKGQRRILEYKMV